MEASHSVDKPNGIADASAQDPTCNSYFPQVPPDSQTASDFIDNQLQLEADAREALPFKFELCTQPLGPLRQNLFSCLTCNPPPDSPSAQYTPAAVCYSCSIACHGEHTLVELFNRRNFVCDCGTTRLPATSPCTLRINPATGMKAPVHSQDPAKDNTYNQNCRNRFCGCGEIYNAEEEKGTMFQCIGLAGEAEGGCGEDWWHPECVVGLGRDWAKAKPKEGVEPKETTIQETETELEHPMPPGFPQEDDFDTFICYKCVEANPWIKRYAGSSKFLPLVYRNSEEHAGEATNGSNGGTVEPNAQDPIPQEDDKTKPASSENAPNGETEDNTNTSSNQPTAGEPAINLQKRTADDAELDNTNDTSIKKSKPSSPYHDHLPAAPSGPLSLFCKEDFREKFCRCPDCYPLLRKHPQLMEEEETYEPPISESGDEEGGQSAATGSLLDRGEAALSNVDRVRAIEGVMAYNHLKDKVKSFLQPFAESGQAVGAEDVKAYFEKLRGDEQGIREAMTEAGSGGDGGGDQRREQSGY